MKLTVSTKNEFKFYPEIGNNMELPEKERFCIVLRKMSSFDVSPFTSFSEKGGGMAKVDLREKAKAQTLRLENPPILDIDGQAEKELTIDILYSGDYTELFDLEDGIISFINKLSQEGGFETKKS